MRPYRSLAALGLILVALPSCDTTAGGDVVSRGASAAESTCLRAVADRVGGAGVSVFAHETYSRGAFTNVEVPSLDTRFICHTDVNGEVFQIAEI